MLKIKQINTRANTLNLVLFFLFCICFGTSCSKNANNTPKPNKTLEIKGADMSFLPEIRQSGIILQNQEDQTEDMLMTLKKSGVNVIRLRLWKNPESSNSDFATVKALAQEIKSLGMQVLLSVHYSDSWADPAKQTKPAAWQNISFDQLLDSVYQYTQKIMAEITPEYIQIGNEINGGFLWPDGSISNFSQFKQLLNQGIKAVKESNTSTKIIIHYAGYENADPFFSKISSLDFDIIGISYYPRWHGKDLQALEVNLKFISERHDKPILIAETSYPFTLNWNDWTNNIIGETNQILNEFEASPEGQKAFLNKIKEISLDVPECVGFCYWGGEWVSYKGTTSTEGSTWENQAFWNFENKSLPVLEAYQ
ncbi:MAG: glycosyl hydrolase 53 family protein [Microscillaceae bacterium]|nr:glycosyl hydrolase 53 family protein [Microscillaceae bacterium]